MTVKQLKERLNRFDDSYGEWKIVGPKYEEDDRFALITPKVGCKCECCKSFVLTEMTREYIIKIEPEEYLGTSSVECVKNNY